MDFISAEPVEFSRQGLHSVNLKLIMRVSCIYTVLSFLAVGVFAAHGAFSQTPGNRMTKIGVENETLATVFTKIKEQTGLAIYYPGKVEEYKNISLAMAKRTVKEVLDLVLNGTDLIYRFKEDAIFIYADREDENSAPINSFPITVTGKVIDADTQQILPGVNIIVKGTTKGTSSDAEGKFMIDAEENEILVFSFIGFKTFEIQIVGGRSTIDVAMEIEAEELQEVTISAGYYDVKDREKTGSISKITSEVISKQPVTNPLAALSGRMPGVYIQQTTGIPGGDFKIEIRGRNSLRSLSNQGGIVDGNEPLYIVDGVPFSSQKVSNRENTQDFMATGTNPLTSINPTDIESIEVLKDADATSIYGSRGSNGVVLITTKKGKAGKTKFDINAYVGAGRASTVKRLNTEQYLALRREGFVNDGIIPSADPTDAGYAPDLMIWDTARYTDWTKLSMGGTLITTNAQASLSGGNDFTQFLFTVGYRKEGSVLLGEPTYKKGSGHLSVNHSSLNKKFLISVSISGTRDGNNQTSANPSFMAELPPNAPALYDESGSLNWENSTWENPLAKLNGTFEGRTGNLITNTTLSYEILPGLNVKSSFGLNTLSSKEFTIIPSTTNNPTVASSADSYVTSGSGSTQSWIVEPQISWSRKVAKGQLSLLAGSSFQEQEYEKSSTFYVGFPSDFMLHNLASASRIVPGLYASKSLYRYAAIFGRINYNWAGKYILNLTARRDGSSRFGPGRKFANFGAIGIAWIFSSEEFLKENISLLSFGKLRGSFGTTGNDQIGDYQYLDTYSTNVIGNTNYQGVAGLTLTRLFNPDFAWESNQKIEGALDLGFFRDRITLSITYYRNRSSNQLVDYTLPKTTGFSGILTNFPATVQNSGIEIELATTNIQSAQLQWTTSLNLSVPRNKLLEFPGLESSTYANLYIVGQPIYIKKLYESTGVDAQTGLYSFKDFNGDDAVTIADRQKAVFIGYDFYGGMNNSVSFKKFTADIFFQFVKQTGYNYMYGLVLPAYRYNPPEYLIKEKRWQKPGDIATIQRTETPSNTEAINAFSNFTTQSDGTIGDASFIRLKTISLSYQLLENRIKGIKCRLFIQGQNVFTITRYKGNDPESQQSSLGPLKILTGGVQLTL